MFFGANPIPPACLENYETTPAQWYKYLTQTDRILRMNRIFVDAKEDSGSSSNLAASAASTSTTTPSTIAVVEDGVPPTACAAGIKDEPAREARPAPLISITKSYGMALNQLLKPGEQPPRAVDEEDEEFYRKYKDVSIDEIKKIK